MEEEQDDEEEEEEEEEEKFDTNDIVTTTSTSGYKNYANGDNDKNGKLEHDNKKGSSYLTAVDEYDNAQSIRVARIPNTMDYYFQTL